MRREILITSNRLLFIGSLILFISCSPTRKIARELDGNFSGSPEFSTGLAGFALYDPASKELIYTYNADKFFIPASNIKLFTLYTGLKILGDSVPALKYTIKGDSLIFKGTGDPSFLNPTLPGSKVYNFLKDNHLKLFYIQNSDGEKPLGPGWAWDDYNSYYSAEKTDLPIYGNLLKIHIDRQSGIASVNPGIFQDSIKTSPSNSHNYKYVRRELGSNKMSYTILPREKDFNQYIPIRFTKGLIPKLLTDTLKKPVSIYPGNPSKLKLDQTIFSIPTDSIYKRMMKESDNFLAEQILMLAAGKISDTLETTKAIDHMLTHHLNDLTSEPRWVDGSGLSRYNLATPRMMVSIILTIEKEISREKLMYILPAGGESGTLKNEYLADTPYIYAKTGSLSNNHSLSGFLITKTGRTLIFSFMNNNYTNPTSDLKADMRQIFEYIRDTY